MKQLTTTCGVYLMMENQLLICKATGGGWSIPKGIPENGESNIKTALRELYEETNIFLEYPVLYIKLPDSKYKNKKKILKSFLICIPKTEFDLKCHSMFDGGNLEVCEYKWSSIEEAKNMLHESQVGNLKLLQR